MARRGSLILTKTRGMSFRSVRYSTSLSGEVLCNHCCVRFYYRESSGPPLCRDWNWERSGEQETRSCGHQSTKQPSSSFNHYLGHQGKTEDDSTTGSS